MDEKSVCANIAELVTRLNGELGAAFRLGLKVTVSATPRFGGVVHVVSCPQPERISIRVWRETDMVQIPARTGRPDWIEKSASEKGDVKQ